MKTNFSIYFICFILFYNCSISKKTTTLKSKENSDFVIAFGSCNNQNKQNLLWESVLKNKPNVWIWGGDNIYADTENMNKMKQDYQKLNNHPEYKTLKEEASILGTWDDHDYGKNDAGKGYAKKKASQDLFLDFMGVAKNDKRREREGVYHAKNIKTPEGEIKIIILDTRYFRDTIIKTNGAYQLNKSGSLLGKTQWKWFENTLKNSKADFNIIVSSIQVLSSEHNFEKWANFPKEVNRFNQLLKNANANGVFVLSGDRHISEFSKTNISGLPYPIIDFTSSGLTHTYNNYTFEPNKYRIKNVVSEVSFGVLKFNFSQKSIKMQMKGVNNSILQEISQTYP